MWKTHIVLIFSPFTTWTWIDQWAGTLESLLWGTVAQTLLKLTHSPFPIDKEYSEQSMAATLSREYGDISRILFS